VFGLDDWLAQLGGGSVALAIAVAVLLGLRHATDPDHLTAVATLIAGDERRGAARARLLGIAWGAGHAVTLFACGLPVVLAGDGLPAAVHTGAELAIALVIAVLAARLLVRWSHGAFHAHPHTHGAVRHTHPHAHEHAHPHGEAHAHAHPAELGRSPRAAFGIGLVHGVGGSAGAGILLVGAVSGGAAGAALLALYAAGTAVSMALASALFGTALAHGRLAGRLEGLVPAFGSCALLFAAWYGLAAMQTVPYPF
jgi:cytochrome c biogenesis protein CcdA